MTIGEYIRAKREEGNIGQRQLAQCAGISHSYLCEIETEKAKAIPTEEILRRISEALKLDSEEEHDFLLMGAFERTPKIVMEELRKREAEVLNLKKLLSDSSNIKEPHNSLDAGYFAPVYESVSAGTGKYAYGEAIDFLPVPETVKKSGNIVYFRVSGDSMEPDIRHGSYVLVKEGVMPENGQEGVFVLEEEWFVKVYRRIGTTVILSSINREYKDIEIESAEGVNFKCVGKVAGVFNFK